MMKVTRLRIERVKQDLTQEALSKLTLGKIRQTRISLIERGVLPYENEAKAIAEVLGVSMSELWPELTQEDG